MTKKKQCSSSSSRSPKKVVGNAVVPNILLSDRPDWLPDDWEMELKPRSGSCRIDRYFICPVSGRKFRSKWDVLRYSNNGGADCVAMEAPPSPPPLPLPLLRPRRSKNLQPTNQLSKHRRPESRHPKNRRLESRHPKNRRPENRSSESHRKLRNVPVIEHLEQVEDSPAGLPEGWIKEIRARKKGDKTDAYYIDPEHGYGFRSKMDVFRYLENEDLSRVVFILKRVHTPDTFPMIDDSLPIVEFLKCTRKRSASKKHFDGNELISNSITPQRAAALSLKYASTKFDEGSSGTACSTTTDNEYLEQYIEPLLIKYHPDLETNDKKPCTEKQQMKCNPCPEINLEEWHEHTTNANFQESEKNNYSPVQLQGKRMPHPDKDNLEEKPSQSNKVRRLQKRKVEKLDPEPSQTSSDTDDLIFNTDIGKRYVKLKSKQIERNMKATEGKLGSVNHHVEAGTAQKVHTTEPNELDKDVSSVNHHVEAGTAQKVHTTEPNESDKDVQKYVESQKYPEIVKPTVGFVSEEHLDLVEKLSSIKLIDEAETSQEVHSDRPKDSYTTGVQKNDEIRKKLKNIKLPDEPTSQEQQHVNLFRRLPNKNVVAETSRKVNITAPNDLGKKDVQKNDEILEELKNIKLSVESASHGQLQVDSFANVPIFIYSWSDPCIEYAFKTLANDEDNEDDDENVEIPDNIRNLEPSVDQQEQHLDLLPKPYGYSWSDPCIDFAFKTLTSDFSSLEEAASLQDYLNHKHTSSLCSNKSASVSIPSSSRFSAHGSKNEKVTEVR